jgi:hypothetical protein
VFVFGIWDCFVRAVQSSPFPFFAAGAAVGQGVGWGPKVSLPVGTLLCI